MNHRLHSTMAVPLALKRIIVTGGRVMDGEFKALLIMTAVIVGIAVFLFVLGIASLKP
jgi:hypothetical protein